MAARLEPTAGRDGGTAAQQTEGALEQVGIPMSLHWFSCTWPAC